MIVKVLGGIDVRRLAMVRSGAPADVVQYAAQDAAPDVLFVWEQRRSELIDILAQYGDHLKWVHFRRVGIGEPIVSLFRPFPHIQLTNAVAHQV